MKCTYLRSCLLGNFSFFSRISPQFTRITALRFFIGFWSKISHFFLQGEGELFLAFGGAGYTLRSYQFGNSSLFCIFSFCWEEFLNYSWVLLSQSLWTPSSVISCAIERSRERPLRSRLPLVCGYCFYPQQPHPFQFSSHHIGKLICLPRNALVVWYGSRSSWWVRIR